TPPTLWVRAMNVRNSLLIWPALVASALMPAPLAGAADLPPPRPLPAWTWSGFYLGGQIGAFGGASTLSDPVGPSVFGDKVNTSGSLVGLQLGYNKQVASRWVVGVLADLSYLDSGGSFTCMQASSIIIGSNCEVSPRARDRCRPHRISARSGRPHDDLWQGRWRLDGQPHRHPSQRARTNPRLSERAFSGRS